MPLFHEFIVNCRLCNRPEKTMTLGINNLGEIRTEILCVHCQVVTGYTHNYDDLLRDCRRMEITAAENIDLAEFVPPPGPPH